MGLRCRVSLVGILYLGACLFRIESNVYDSHSDFRALRLARLLSEV